MEDMKAIKFCGIRAPGLAIAAIAFSAGLSAQAATRTAYFNQSGQNRTVNGISADATSSCRITISNPSGQDQTYILRMSASSLDSWAAAGPTTAQNATFSSATPSGTASYTAASCPNCSGTLPAGTSITITYNFSTYPQRHHATTPVTTGTQKLRCSGSIEATDTTQPGFLVANGTLVTFVESTKMSTDGVTAGNTEQAQFGGMAVYTQVPISVNKGKPF